MIRKATIKDAPETIASAAGIFTCKVVSQIFDAA